MENEKLYVVKIHCMPTIIKRVLATVRHVEHNFFFSRNKKFNGRLFQVPKLC